MSEVEKEQKWLPKLAPLLPLPIPEPVAMGESDERYPWKWSIYRWIDGKSVESGDFTKLEDLARDLSHFLTVFHGIDKAEGPPPGQHNFYRGGSLTAYDEETRKAVEVLQGKIDVDTALQVWDFALSTLWRNSPVWVHGDISSGNLLIREGRLCAVIDFGGLAVGDPACDLAITWTLFKGESRKIFRKGLPLDNDTWARGRAWTLWKSLIVAAGFSDPGNAESKECWRIIGEVLEEHKTYLRGQL